MRESGAEIKAHSLVYHSFLGSRVMQRREDLVPEMSREKRQQRPGRRRLLPHRFSGWKMDKVLAGS